MAAGQRSDDRISLLPEPILHHVISFLPTKEAIRTIALSTTFRSAFFSFPIIDFDQTFLSWPIPDSFLDCVRTCLSRRTPNIALQKFRFHFKGNDDEESDYVIREAIRFVQENVIKEVDLHAMHYPYHYKVPLRISLLQSVMVLNLEGLKLRERDLKIGCVSIERLGIVDCRGLKSLEASSSRLKFLQINSCPGLRLIDIEAPNLESFLFTGNYVPNPAASEPCTIHMTNLNVVKNIFIRRATIGSDWLNDNVQKLPQLETLKLIHCRVLKVVNFVSASLKEFEIYECYNTETIEVNAPNLESFSYVHGWCMQSEINIEKCILLRKLSLECASVTDCWIENHMRTFPFLEDLVLVKCEKLEKIQFSHDKLKSFKLIDCDNFWCMQSEINIGKCILLRKLSLECASVTDCWIENHMPSFPFLEDLVLVKCEKLEKIKISHDKLKSFKLIDCDNVEEVDISSPNLIAFVHCGEELTTPLLNDFSGQDTHLSWYSDYHARVLTVFCQSEKLLILLKRLSEEYYYSMGTTCKHMFMRTSSKIKDFTKFLDTLLWHNPFHSKTISIFSDLKKTSLELHFSKYKSKEDDEDGECCKNQDEMCWRHFLKEITLENFEEIDRKKLIEFFDENAKALEKITEKSTP